MMDREDLLHLRKFVTPEFVFGVKARKLAAQYARNLGARHVLIVTDPGVIAAGWTQDIINQLEEERIPYSIFSNVTPNPKDYEVMAGAEVYREHRCNLLIAVGGGSPIDCAKGIGIVCTNGKNILDFEGVDLVQIPCPPMICIPTTAGTSADVSQFAIITDTTRKTKIVIISKTVVPDVSLVDPETTVTMISKLTASTGMDAFSHAAESLLSNVNSPVTDLHALETLRLIHSHLKQAKANPDNLNHRSLMMLASLQAGLAFSNASLGLVHAMAHSLGGLKDLVHGECTSILLPFVIDYNFSHSPERYIMLAKALGLDLSGTDMIYIKEIIISAIKNLLESVDITWTLSQMGITRADIPNLAQKALNDPCIVTNPRRPNQMDIEELYERAL